MKRLIKIQKELKVPKNQYNSFGKYKYRSCEDILEGLKPLLDDCTITVSDEIVTVQDRFYVKAKATFEDIDGYKKEVVAYAREELSKKGMDGSQVTGAASSYARKYALNGLLCIDDAKDADSSNPKDNNKTNNQTYNNNNYNNQNRNPDKNFQPPNNVNVDKNKVITEGQIKRLYAITSNSKNGWNQDVLKESINYLWGYKSTSEIKVSQYEYICNAVSSLTPQQFNKSVAEKIKARQNQNNNKG